MTCKHSRSGIDQFLYGRITESKRCALCRKEIYQRHYQKNKAKILAKTAEYRQKNPDKIKAIRDLYYAKERVYGTKDRKK